MWIQAHSFTWPSGGTKPTTIKADRTLTTRTHKKETTLKLKNQTWQHKSHAPTQHQISFPFSQLEELGKPHFTAAPLKTTPAFSPQPKGLNLKKKNIKASFRLELDPREKEREESPTSCHRALQYKMKLETESWQTR